MDISIFPMKNINGDMRFISTPLNTCVTSPYEAACSACLDKRRRGWPRGGSPLHMSTLMNEGIPYEEWIHE
jgi:hypothetical protein